MTITAERLESPPSRPRTCRGEGVLETLRDTLHDTLDVVSGLDPDLLHSHGRAGHAVVNLAGAARDAAEALGTAPGNALGTAPGVVVVRDLVAAASLLELAASRRDRAPATDALQQIAHRADDAYEELLRVLPAPR